MAAGRQGLVTGPLGAISIGLPKATAKSENGRGTDMAKIAIIGGTGHLGKGIARRLAKAGHEVTIGSRSAERAAALGAEMGGIGGASTEEAARGKDIVFVAVPYDSHESTLRQIAPYVGDAIVVDTTVPLKPPKVMRVQLPAAGCAALEAQGHLGEGIRLVTTFHNVSAHLLDSDEPVECDVLVFGDDAPARTAIVELVAGMRLRALSGGVLANSAAAEALTSILIYMNKTYQGDGAGIRFTRLGTARTIP
jgi:NADPH-dependent F420 reductase